MKVLDASGDERLGMLYTKMQYADGRVITAVTPMVTAEEQTRIDAYLESL